MPDVLCFLTAFVCAALRLRFAMIFYSDTRFLFSLEASLVANLLWTRKFVNVSSNLIILSYEDGVGTDEVWWRNNHNFHDPCGDDTCM